MEPRPMQDLDLVQILTFGKTELVAKVEKHPDVAKSLLESLEDGEDAASAIAEIIEGAGRRLAVALANVEGKAAA